MDEIRLASREGICRRSVIASERKSSLDCELKDRGEPKSSKRFVGDHFPRLGNPRLSDNLGLPDDRWRDGGRRVVD